MAEFLSDDLMAQLLTAASNSLMDSRAKKAGYDPSNEKILSALSMDYGELSNPQNALGPAYGLNNLTVGQIIESYQQRKFLEDMIDHYGKRFGKPQKTSKDSSK